MRFPANFKSKKFKSQIYGKKTYLAMYGNFTTNLFKISLSHRIFRYSICESIPEFSLSLLAPLIKSALSSSGIWSIISKSFLYTNQSLSQLSLKIQLETSELTIKLAEENPPFLTEKREMKEFINAFFNDCVEEVKYFSFGCAFYNPFEALEDKPREITIWPGFSFKVKRLMNDFALQVSPKTLIFSKKNCHYLLGKLQTLSEAAITRTFKGKHVQVKPNKDLKASEYLLGNENR